MMTKAVVLLLLLAMALLSSVEGQQLCGVCEPPMTPTKESACDYLTCVTNSCSASLDTIKAGFSSFDCSGARGLLSSPILLVTAVATILVYIRG